MYVDKIVLKNIKGFEHLDFSFARPDGSYEGWTVFTGDNGSGKSTLLKAMVLAIVGNDVARSLQPSFHRWTNDGKSIAEGSVSVTLQPEKGIDEYLKKGGTSYKKIDAQLKFEVVDGETILQSNTSTRTSAAQRGPWSVGNKGWFSCGYGPFRRVFGASTEATRLMVAPITERYVTMFQEAASLFEVDQWLRTLSHRKLEKKVNDGQLLDLILELLDDELMPNEISIDSVDSEGLWLKDRNGIRLAWKDMSDGYRAALALLIDIVRHLAKTYGFENLISRRSDGTIYIGQSGVVFIDEIDAHLHPEWQREIGFWLKKHFPKIQFLVTTHSPLICQAADENGLFVLPEPGSEAVPRLIEKPEYEKIISARADEILLSPAFGLRNTRSERAVKARADYSLLQSKKRSGATMTPQEKNLMSQLQLFVKDEKSSETNSDK